VTVVTAANLLILINKPRHNTKNPVVTVVTRWISTNLSRHNRLATQKNKTYNYRISCATQSSNQLLKNP